MIKVSNPHFTILDIVDINTNILVLILSLYCLPYSDSKRIIQNIERLIEQNDRAIKLNVIDNVDQILSSDLSSIPAIKTNEKVYSFLDHEWLYDGLDKVSIEQFILSLLKAA